MTVVTSNTIQPSSGQALTIKDEGGTASITVATNGEATFAENIIVTNGKGIDFSAVSGSASGSASAVLDDYEEGTWTPTITAQSGSLTSATATNGTYTKIGRTVTCSVYVTINTVGTGANAMVLTLPFVADSENFSGSGAERSVTGLMLAVFGEQSGGTIYMHVRKYDFNSILVANYGMRIQATFLTS